MNQCLRRLARPALKIGTNDDGDRILLPYSVRDSHLHVIGRTRSGKSRFLADLITQDIASGQGLCLIDPHGELYDMVIEWLARNKPVTKYRKIHPINFSNPTTTFRYNPLHIDHPDEAQVVGSSVANTLTHVFAGNDPNSTPLIKSTLNTICVILAMQRRPLADARYFVFEKYAKTRKEIVRAVTNPYYRDLGEALSEKTMEEFREVAEPTERRLRTFIANPIVQRIFSSTENTISLREMMDKRHVVLMNCRKQNKLIDLDALRALPMLFVRSTFEEAFERDPDSDPVPFYLYIDEAHDYVSDDIEKILSRSAKFGLYLTLSHQLLWQLAQAGKLVYNGVMSGTLLKAVFSLPFEEALVFADELFSDRVDFQRIKEKIQIPVTVGHEIAMLPSQSRTRTVGGNSSEATQVGSSDVKTESESETNQESEAHAVMRADTQGRAVGEMGGVSTAQIAGVNAGAGAVYDPQSGGFFAGPTSTSDFSSSGSSTVLSEFSAWSVADIESHTDAETEQRGKARANTLGKAHATGTNQSKTSTLGRSHSIADTEGLSATLIPITKMMATQTYTLEEQRYDLARLIQQQRPRHGFLAVAGEGTVGFITRTMPDPLKIPETKKRLLERLVDRSHWLTASADIALPAEAKPYSPPNAEPESYFEEEE